MALQDYDVFSRCHPAVNFLFFVAAIVLTVVLFLSCAAQGTTPCCAGNAAAKRFCFCYASWFWWRR